MSVDLSLMVPGKHKESGDYKGRVGAMHNWQRDITEGEALGCDKLQSEPSDGQQISDPRV